ncbi:hypothetical protein CRG98_041551 [Punica granatum]|uniref:Uncharacterized protein n=1 Tax=Punica granatum TaxID=22663 RepID=A0A2I0I2A7_PUNGR|nr:hypothetical protein CRG98_041551 [Punica granatum]
MPDLMHRAFERDWLRPEEGEGRDDDIDCDHHRSNRRSAKIADRATTAPIGVDDDDGGRYRP